MKEPTIFIFFVCFHVYIDRSLKKQLEGKAVWNVNVGMWNLQTIETIVVYDIICHLV